MRKTYLLITLLIALSSAFAQTPTLGVYPATTIIAAGNAVVTPSTLPTNALRTTAYTNTGFNGLLYVNPATGKLTITNASPAGTYTVTVKAFNGTATTLTSFMLTVNNSVCNNIGATVYYPVADGPYLMLVGDFNGDGNQDLISGGGYPYYGRIAVSLGNGMGSFYSSTTTSLGNNSSISIATGDFNGDGKLDLMAATTGHYIAVRPGNGNGGFGATTTFPIDTNTVSLVVSDFNSDGRLDFATASVLTRQVIVRLGDGNGNFSGTNQVSIGASPKSMTAADFNGDGYMDFATANSTAANDSVSVRLGDGNGNFTTRADFSINRLYFPSGNAALTIGAGDMNRDGYTDIVVAKPNNNAVAVCLSNGNGTFSTPTFVEVGYYPMSVDLKDINGDGNLDIITANFYSNNISVRFGNGAGAFTGTSNFNVSQYVIAAIAGDLNGDGKYDIISGNNYGNNASIAILKGIGNEINVQGNSQNIFSDSNVADTTNYTYVGNVLTGSNLVRIFFIQNTGNDTLRVSNITVSGTDSLLFTRSGLSLPTNILPGTSQPFTVKFSPVDGGFKTGRINIFNDDCDEANYQFAVAGKAICTTLSANNVWLGLTANWNMASNWSLGFVPNGCGVAVVNTGVPFMPQISTAASCYSLTLNNGATFTVTSTGSLTITGP